MNRIITKQDLEQMKAYIKNVFQTLHTAPLLAEQLIKVIDAYGKRNLNNAKN